jgi:predicted lysophospholipase L1 biosynthesis ABC-type transport system permease subunit
MVVFNMDTLINLAINVIINVVILSPVLWISGRLIAGKDKAKFTDAVWIVVLGTLIGLGFNYFAESLGTLTGLIAAVIMLIIWLGLVKHFFDCGWLKALAISILAVIIFMVIVAVLAIIGIGIALIWF